MASEKRPTDMSAPGDTARADPHARAERGAGRHPDPPPRSEKRERLRIVSARAFCAGSGRAVTESKIRWWGLCVNPE